MVILRSRTRQRPPDARGGYELPTGEVSARGETYEEAYASLLEQVPEGWQLLGIHRDSE